MIPPMSGWPSLPLAPWRDTYETLHRWSQIPGKILLDRTPLVNHFWNAAFRVTPRGLTSGSMVCPEAPGGCLEMCFDFVDHTLLIATSGGDSRTVALRPVAVADFYGEVMEALSALGIHPRIWTMPVEIPDPIRFEEDRVHHAYDRDAAERFHHVLLAVDPVFQRFRSGYLGKSSPVHFFWGSFDLCVTRFSGRRAPENPNADTITREAYSHEVSSVGWWPGGGQGPFEKIEEPMFYAYAAPEPEGFGAAKAKPSAASYDAAGKLFLLPYEAVRTAPDPAADLLAFCQSTYEAAAETGKWNRRELERISP
jgi:hypothetical protein